ncbi:MAG: hypothetical protein IJI42_05510 [Methanobrevibacter sp.]|nr:hypothetical protein [Methanobrevibacter sp.]
MTKRFIVESVMIDCLCEDEPRIAKVITDTKETYSYEDLDEIVSLLNEQQELIEELYDFRLTYNALLFNEWAENQKYEVYKSRRHGDGELCFDGEYFIVVAQLPTGQVTNHYHIRHWDMFKINEYEKVKEDFDGHTPSDVIERLQQVIDDE